MKINHQAMIYFLVMISLIAVFCSPFMMISLNAGMTTKLSPDGATKPRQMAIALIA